MTGLGLYSLSLNGVRVGGGAVVLTPGWSDLPTACPRRSHEQMRTAIAENGCARARNGGPLGAYAGPPSRLREFSPTRTISRRRSPQVFVARGLIARVSCGARARRFSACAACRGHTCTAREGTCRARLSDTQPRATVVATALHPRDRRRPSQTKQRAALLPPRRSMAASANASACASGGGDRVAPCGSAVSQTALRRRRECAWDAARAGQVWIRIRVLRSGGRDVIARSAPMSTRVGL